MIKQRFQFSPTDYDQCLKKSQAVLDCLVQAAAYTPCALASSFSPEDIILIDIIRCNQLDIEIFSLDTGRLPPETYELIEALEKHYGAGFKIFFPETQAVESYVALHGINAFYRSIDLRKNCCRIRKTEPLKRALQGKKAWVTGMRSGQSITRQSLVAQHFDDTFQLEKFNPLHNWTEKEVWCYLLNRNLPYNKLHDQFYPSIGCAPCSRPVALGEDVRAGRWWWEDPDRRECGLHRST